MAGQVGGDLRAGVAAADHDDALVHEVLRAAVVDGVQLAAGEVGPPGHGGQKGRDQVPVALTTAFACQMSVSVSTPTDPSSRCTPWTRTGRITGSS